MYYLLHLWYRKCSAEPIAGVQLLAKTVFNFAVRGGLTSSIDKLESDMTDAEILTVAGRPHR